MVQIAAHTASFRVPLGRVLARTGLALTLAALVLGTSSGCYRRVIATHGLGTETVTTEEPYQESGELDRWLFGDKPNERKP